ncbi:restriction endonuclease subunit S [Moorella naiadis]|uniref:restriction endonuclease subunit S n=1 Tax=Moorella naiadis (nom. illeg.) TaxID=3093670 RepID=UPI003D9CA757
MKWPMLQLDKLASVSGGSTPKRNRSEYWDGDIPWVTPTDLPLPGSGIADVYDTADHITETGLRSCAANLLPVGTVLYSSRATIGKIGIARVPLATNQGFTNFIPKPGVDSKYLAYALQYFTGEISSLAGSTTFKEIRRGALKKYKLPLPSPSEQRRIVEILDQADALRKKRVEADARAARILPALFYKMFGDPVTNPKGWPTRFLGDPDVAEINPRFDGGNPQPETEFGFVPMSDIDEKWGRIVGSQCRPFAEVSRGYTPFKDRDILFAKITPCMQNGKSAIASGLRNGYGFGSTEFHVLRAGAMATPEWLYCLVRLKVFRRQAVASFTGSAGQQRVPVDFLKRYRIPCPPLELQHRFAVAVQDILNRANQVDELKNKVEQIFQNLLHRAFTGDLTAKWREAHMKELLAEMEQQAKALEAPACEKGKPEVRTKRHAGHDMYNKAALAAYITQKCHEPDRPIGRVKLAKLFYLVQRKAKLELTETFAKRAAGPLDDEFYKFLNLAQKKGWVILGKAQGKLKPVWPGANAAEATEQTAKLLGQARIMVDQMLEGMKGWRYPVLECWATVLEAAEALDTLGSQVTVASIKDEIQRYPDWRAKLERKEFSDRNIEAALRGLRSFGFIPTQN